MRQLHIELDLPQDYTSIRKHLVANVSEYGKLTRCKLNEYVTLEHSNFYDDEFDEVQHSLWFGDVDEDCRYAVEVVASAPDEEQGRLHWRGHYVVILDTWRGLREILWEEFHFYEIVCG